MNPGKALAVRLTVAGVLTGMAALAGAPVRADDSITWHPLSVPSATPTSTPGPVCQTTPSSDTETRVVFEALEIAGSPITDYRPSCTAQMQPDDDAAKSTYRWECGGTSTENYFSLYVRGLTEAGKSVDLTRNYIPPRLNFNFDTASPNLAVFFRTPTSSRMTMELVCESQAVQNFTVASAVIHEHRMLGRRGRIGELRFVRGCAEFEFQELTTPNERGDRRPAGKLKVFFQGELEDLTLRSKKAVAQPSPAAPSAILPPTPSATPAIAPDAAPLPSATPSGPPS